MELVLPLIVSGTGVAVALAAFINRDRDDWRRATPTLLVPAVGQVTLGAIAWLVLNSN